MPKARVRRDGKSQAYFHPSPASTLLLLPNTGFTTASSPQACHTPSLRVTPKQLAPLSPKRCLPAAALRGTAPGQHRPRRTATGLGDN